MISLGSGGMNYIRTMTLLTLQTNRRCIPTLDFPNQCQPQSQPLVCFNHLIIGLKKTKGGLA